jgi:ANTAR domain
MYPEQLDREPDAVFWRERAEQLQQALDSRVVIEQAKGVLGERFGLGLEGAFGLLRAAARRRRMKLHALAREVVENNDTPAPIVEMLALNAETFTSVPRNERVIRTEELYRRLNESIAGLLSDGSARFLCECGNPVCNETIDLDRDDLRMLHAKPGFYAIIPGHDIPDVETVVLENEDYAVVRKMVPPAR